MFRECQNLERNPQEKHTTLHDKSTKMQCCVNGRESKGRIKTCKGPRPDMLPTRPDDTLPD
jgi:hypothetical protein